ncbi:GlpG protein [Halospina denitrificans]|uniref:GlpG protein n=1 Tax=Halospina denitrificans TaxID=332522 RepID=A0A4R7JN11_9GAMM|nr:rhomboid family intramembrane serine protease [Halospina denitrificans]TDT38577.1 GlpG protein [Halospina denitrificans]
MIRIASIPQTIDLGPFSQWLDSQQVIHEIVSGDGHQELYVEGEHLREPVTVALERYMDDPRFRTDAPTGGRQHVHRSIPRHWQAGPKDAVITFSLIVVAGIVAWVTAFGAREPLMVMLTAVNPLEWPVATMTQRVDALVGTLASGQVWRLLTPDLLHFSVMHLVFNAVMLWFLGSQIEALDGRRHIIGLILLTSLGANVPQYLISGPLFGGLSGVVYGVLGYVWLVNQWRPRFQFPPALMTVAVVWLLIGFTPLTQALIGANMANAAHLGGLVSGVLYGFIVSVFRLQRRN